MKQYNPGRWLGAYKVQLMRSLTYYGFFTGLFAAIAARAQLQVWFPWLTFPMILVGLFILLHVVMVFDHVFVKRSEFGHMAEQSYIPENPSVKDLTKLKADIGKIKKHLGIED